MSRLELARLRGVAGFAIAGGADCRTVIVRFRLLVPVLLVEVAVTTMVYEAAGVPELGSFPVAFPPQVASDAARRRIPAPFETIRTR